MGFFKTFLGLRHPKDGNELVGIWERRDDQFSGCVVRVEREVNELVGKIIVSTQKMLTAGWNVGDRKWRLIQANPEGLWQLIKKHRGVSDEFPVVFGRKLRFSLVW
jgi:hypothetical protein